MMILLFHEHAYQQLLTGIASPSANAPPLLPLTPAILQPILLSLSTHSSSHHHRQQHPPTGTQNQQASSGKIRRTYYQAFHHHDDTNNHSSHGIAGNEKEENGKDEEKDRVGEEEGVEEWMVSMLTKYWYEEMSETDRKGMHEKVHEWLKYHHILSSTSIWHFVSVFYYQQPLPTAFPYSPTIHTTSELTLKLLKLLSHLPAPYTSLPTYFTHTLHYPLPVFCSYLLTHYDLLFFALFPPEEVLVLNALEALDGYRCRYVLLVLIGWLMRLHDEWMEEDKQKQKRKKERRREEEGLGILYVQKQFIAVGKKIGSLAKCFNAVEGWMISSHHSLTILSLLNTTLNANH